MGPRAFCSRTPWGDQQSWPSQPITINFCPWPHASSALLLPASLCFPSASVTWHPDTEPQNRTEYFCRYFCTKPPCLLCSTCVHGNKSHLSLLRGINLGCLQFTFFTVIRPISIFLKKKEFQMQNKLSLFMGNCSTQMAGICWKHNELLLRSAHLLNSVKRSRQNRTDSKSPNISAGTFTFQ